MNGHKLIAAGLMVVLCLASCTNQSIKNRIARPTGDTLVFHEILVDPEGNILPWNNDDPALAYDDVLNRLWTFLDTLKRDYNGLPFYMNHLAWSPDVFIDRGIGGDQFAMMLSSWQLWYLYSGITKVHEAMHFMADYYLKHSLTPKDCLWPNLPYPQNTCQYSGIYDGDMVIGPDYLQPDKAGSFGWELYKLYQITRIEPQRSVYLNAAKDIANTLAHNIRPADNDRSPWPFKVNAFTGVVGDQRTWNYMEKIGTSEYTTNYAPTMDLFLALIKEGVGETDLYKKTVKQVTDWMTEYPVKTNKWGPFFEDIPVWSDTQTNAVTWAQYLINHKEEADPLWKEHARQILDWSFNTFRYPDWEKYGVTAIFEQTVYHCPGNSHTSREACAELQYAAATGDTSRVEQAVRQLNWATYMVNEKGWNRYPNDDIWFTDGYGDYIRHYLLSMAAMPDLAPAESHILASSGIKKVDYTVQDGKHHVYYETADQSGDEIIRLSSKPDSVCVVDGIRTMMFRQSHVTTDPMIKVEEGITDSNAPLTWKWKECKKGGYVTIHRNDAMTVEIIN